MVYAHSYGDPHLPTEFLDYYLAQMASASSAAGFPLLDVLDVHYYTNNGSPAPSSSRPACSSASAMTSPSTLYSR